jgi:hypothetical protein
MILKTRSSSLMKRTFSGRVRSEGAVSVGDVLLVVDVLSVESEEKPNCLGAKLYDK